MPGFEHAILRPERVHELVLRARAVERGGRLLLAGTSFVGAPFRRRTLPNDVVLPEAVVAASDFLLLHGNASHTPDSIEAMVRTVRALPTYRPMPEVFNEDDHFDFNRPVNNLLVATANHASWGYFDPGTGAGGAGAGSDYRDGYQLVPVNWGINTERKRAFFDLVAEITGADGVG